MVDAARRSPAATGVVGARVVVVQAVDERARTFCKWYGFRPHSDREPLMPVLRMVEMAGLPRPRAASTALHPDRAKHLYRQVLDGQHAGK